MMKILIVGCGYLGAALAEHFVEKGHEVWGLRRTPGGNSKFRTITADLLESDTLKGLPETDTVILCQAPQRDEDNYGATYFEGTKNILNAIQTCPPVLWRESPRIIFISSTGVYGVRDGSWVDEATDPGSQGYADPRAEGNAQILLDTERLVLQSGLSAMVFRLGGIYGPGRHRLGLLKEGKIEPSFSNVYVNRIRLEDIVAGVEILLAKGRQGEIYLGVDEEPATQNEFYSWLVKKLRLEGKGAIPATNLGGSAANFGGNRAPTENVSVFSGKRCSNKKIKVLGMRFQYPTFREGYMDLLDEK